MTQTIYCILYIHSHCILYNYWTTFDHKYYDFYCYVFSNVGFQSSKSSLRLTWAPIDLSAIESQSQSQSQPQPPTLNGPLGPKACVDGRTKLIKTTPILTKVFLLLQYWIAWYTQIYQGIIWGFSQIRKTNLRTPTSQPLDIQNHPIYF